MKKISLLVIVLCAVFSCNNQRETDLTKSNLNGKVKSYTISEYKAENRFGKIERGRQKFSFAAKFNDKGNQVEKNSFNSDGSLDYNCTYKYDDKGNKVKENCYNSDGSLYKWYIYNYDDKGNKILEERFYKSGGVVRHTKLTRKYDEKGNQVEDNFYNSDGSLGARYIYKYDDKRNLVESNFYKSDGSLGVRWIYKYDDKRNRVESNRYKSDGSLDIKHTFKYEFDEIENWTKQIEFNKGTPILITERVFEYF